MGAADHSRDYAISTLEQLGAKVPVRQGEETGRAFLGLEFVQR
jgi:hypothetical protein